MVHSRAKLTEEQVLEIRAAYQAGDIDYDTVGSRYGVAALTPWPKRTWS